MKLPATLVLCLLGAALGGAAFAQETEEDIRRLEDITVTGTRTEKRLKDSPVTTEVITEEEIDNSSAATLSDVLEDYGLLFSSGDMGDDIQLQGLGEARILFLVDGKRVSGRVSDRIQGESLPLSNVKRIEIIRGPQSALYGSDALGGVVNIITKKPGGELSFTASIDNRFLPAYDDPKTGDSPGPFEKGLFAPFREQNLSASLGLPIGPTRNLLNIEGSRGEEFLNEDKSAAILPKYYRGRAGLDTAFPLGEAAEMRLGGSFMAMRSDERTNVSGSFIRRDYLRAEGYVETGFSLKEAMNITLRLYDNYYQRDKQSYSALTGGWGRDDYDNENYLSLEFLGTYEGYENLVLVAGAEGAVNTADKYTIRTDGLSIVDKEALFFQAEWFREDKFSLLGGIRLERNSQFGFAPAPKVSGMYYLPGGFRLLGGAGLGYRAPSFTDLYVTMDDTIVAGHPTVLGNEDLMPEYALGFNLGIEYLGEGPVSARINGYYTELWNEIVYTYQGLTSAGREIWMNENIDRTVRTGFDTEGRVVLFGSAYMSAAYSWLFAWDRGADAEMHVHPAHTVRGKLGWDHKKSGVNTYVQGRFLSSMETDSRVYDSRFILDFYIAVSFAKHFTIRASADNLTGLVHPLSPAVGRVFSLGFKYVL
jgi:outer membrane receptor for ferrienterochelin and colicins